MLLQVVVVLDFAPVIATFLGNGWESQGVAGSQALRRPQHNQY